MSAWSRAVIFDYGNVLGRSSPEWAQSIEAEFGLTRAQWAPLIAGSGGLETALGGRPFTTREMVPPLAELLQAYVAGRATELAGRLVQVFVDPGVNRPVEGALELLRELKASGTRIGVLTNGPSDAGSTSMAWLWDGGVVDAFVLSGADGVGKPHAAAFSLVLERLGVSARDAWFVDDDPAHVAAGTRQGIRSVVRDGDLDKLRADLRQAGLSW